MSNWGMVKFQFESDGHYMPIALELARTQPDKNKQVRQNSKDIQRSRQLLESMESFLVDADLVCVEVPVGSQSARAMASYGMCIMGIATVRQPLIQVTPQEVKLAGPGNKTASKEAMIDWAMDAYPYLQWPAAKSHREHLADAIGAVHAGMLTDEFKLVQTTFMRKTA